jgi:hypothetical protein
MGVGEGVNLGMEGYVLWSGLREGDGGCADCADINPAGHYAIVGYADWEGCVWLDG